ncbi:MAG: SRPBCC family protein [Massilia sp.]
MQPDQFSVKRSIAIQAPPEKIAALLTDFHRWPDWSPWEHLDPTMKRGFSGASAGQGAVYTWSGNKDAGAGRMEIVEAASAAKTVIKLDFIAPFESHNTTVFKLLPSGAATTVEWDMSGPMPFVSKIMSVFFSMDKLIGKDFERGLRKLKAAAEK